MTSSFPVSHSTEFIKKDPIAIIGIGCRFPKANNPEEFWQILKNGIDAVGEKPAYRSKLEGFNDIGGFLDRVDLFDANFFGISAAEVLTMDVQQRLLLEVAYEALEDAGIIPSQLTDKSCGVFMGISNRDYPQLVYENFANYNHVNTGCNTSLVANRISYHFDFTAPSLTINTACSSSLVAIHSACQSLWMGEASLALAGGANIIVYETGCINFSQSPNKSVSNLCRTFDAQADGFVRSEGVGVVVLKSLNKALENGDRIYAVIRGSGVNQNGRSNGITAPNLQAQENLLESVYQSVGISPECVNYVEAHGTATRMGDAIEMKALGKVLSQNRLPSHECIVGCVKTHIGHTEAASGIAGLIKVALLLKNRQIPPNLHFNNPNPYIPFDKLSLKIPQKLESFSNNNKSIIAGVSSFGFGGTNAHVILEEFTPKVINSAPNLLPLQLLTLSAKTENSLQNLVIRYCEFLEKYPTISLNDLCYTVNTRRSQFNYRVYFVAESRVDLSQQLKVFLEEKDNSKLIYKLNVKNQKKVKLNKIFVVQKETKILLVMGEECPHLNNIPQSMIYSSISLSQSKELEVKKFMNNLGELWLKGVKIDWTNYYFNQSCQVISLPTYPFEYESYWLNFSSHKLNNKQTLSNLSEAKYLRPELETIYILPRNDIEEKIVEIWEKILLIKPIGIEDNFFELGGNSLLGTQIMSRIQETFKKELPLSCLFENPNIAQLSILLNTSEDEIEGFL